MHAGLSAEGALLLILTSAVFDTKESVWTSYSQVPELQPNCSWPPVRFRQVESLLSGGSPSAFTGVLALDSLFVSLKACS